MDIKIDDYYIIVFFHGDIDSSHASNYRKQLDTLIEKNNPGYDF